MKTYVKPTVDVVELSVKENMAALPSAVNASGNPGSYLYGGAPVTTTVYDLTVASTSTTQGI